MGNRTSKTVRNKIEESNDAFVSRIWHLRDLDDRIKSIKDESLSDLPADFVTAYFDFQEYWIHMSEDEILMLYNGAVSTTIKNYQNAMLEKLSRNLESNRKVYSKTTFVNDEGYLRLTFYISQEYIICVYAAIIPADSQIAPYKYITIQTSNYSNNKTLIKYNTTDNNDGSSSENRSNEDCLSE